MGTYQEIDDEKSLIPRSVSKLSTDVISGHGHNAKVTLHSPSFSYLFERHKASVRSRPGSGANQNDRDDRYIHPHLNWRVIEVPTVSIVTNRYITYFATVPSLPAPLIS
jgi:hypothetical protein